MHLCINAAAAFYPYLSHLKASYKPPADATNARCGYPEPLFVCEATGVVYAAMHWTWIQSGRARANFAPISRRHLRTALEGRR
jgi:hypothetical protein